MDSDSEPQLRLLYRKPQADLLPRQPELPAPVFAQPEVPVAPARSEDGPREYTVHHNMVATLPGLGASWERDHLGRPAGRAGRPRSQKRTRSIENHSTGTGRCLVEGVRLGRQLSQFG